MPLYGAALHLLGYYDPTPAFGRGGAIGNGEMRAHSPHQLLSAYDTLEILPGETQTAWDHVIPRALRGPFGGGAARPRGRMA